jgi:hypothetical protein
MLSRSQPGTGVVNESVAPESGNQQVIEPIANDDVVAERWAGCDELAVGSGARALVTVEGFSHKTYMRGMT